AEIANDALAAGIQLGGNDYDLMALVQRIAVQRSTEACLEVGSQLALRLETLIDGRDLVRLQALDPGGVIQRLCHHLAWGAVTLQLDQYQRGVGRQSQQVDAAGIAGADLPADQKPVLGQ